VIVESLSDRPLHFNEFAELAKTDQVNGVGMLDVKLDDSSYLTSIFILYCEDQIRFLEFDPSQESWRLVAVAEDGRKDLVAVSQMLSEIENLDEHFEEIRTLDHEITATRGEES